MLDLSKIESERLDLFAGTFDLATVLDEVGSTVGSLIAKNNNRLRAWRMDIHRGAGFYYDACYAVTDFTTIWTVVDRLTGSAVTTARSALAGYKRDTMLW